MVTWLAEQITNKLILANIIDPNELDLYVYGFFLLISKVFFLILSVFVGFVLNITTEALVFYASFIILREYAGGIHAKTELVCTTLTSLAIVISIVLAKLMILWHAQVLPVLMLSVGSVSIFTFSPLETVEKSLVCAERLKYRKISVQIVIGYFIAVVVAWSIDYESMAYGVICAVFLEGILLLAGKISIS